MTERLTFPPTYLAPQSIGDYYPELLRLTKKLYFAETVGRFELGSHLRFLAAEHAKHPNGVIQFSENHFPLFLDLMQGALKVDIMSLLDYLREDKDEHTQEEFDIDIKSALFTLRHSMVISGFWNDRQLEEGAKSILLKSSPNVTLPVKHKNKL